MGPTLLVASPQMTDGIFEGAVILVWDHTVNGAMGVVINKVVDLDIEMVLIPESDATVVGDHHRVSLGGPVENDSGTLICESALPEREAWNLDCGISVSRSQEALFQLLAQGTQVLLCLGYAGWGAGQLEDEIVKGSWLCVDIDPNLVFRTDPDDIYEAAIAQLGLHSSMLWMSPVNE